ncbi:MAG: cbb3-type cytochrome c oxidase subunit I [Acidimicrobiales bacterium]
MTETRSPATAEPEPPAPAVAAPPKGGPAGMLGHGDHKTTGRLFIGCSLVFLVVAGAAGALLGIEKVDPATIDVLTGESLAVAFTLHNVGSVFLFLLPLTLGLAIYVVPLQVGSSTIAFPRAAAAAFWTWLLAGVLLLVSYGIDAGPAGTDRNAILLWITALGAVTVALTLATLCVVTTVLTLRAEGMRLERVPMFSWSMLAAGTVWILSLPVLVAVLLLLWLDVRYDVGLLAVTGGIGSHVAWVFLPPQILAFAVPALGVVADVVPVFAKVRLAPRNVFLGLIGAAAALGFGAWMFIVPEADRLPDQALFVLMGLAAALPVLGFTGGVADAFRRGTLSVAPPVLAAVLGLLLILGGVAAGAFGVLPFNNLVPTTWFGGEAHLVLGGSAVVLLGGIYHWAPKIWGRVLPDGTGRLAAVAAFGGVGLLALPDLITGGLGQVSRLPATQEVDDAWSALNVVSLAGGGLLLLAVVLVMVSAAGALGGTRKDAASTPDDPWEGHTLEWATSSPPPVGNFADPPAVESATPLLDRREAEAES